ncbi:MAG: acylphosphatase [Bacteroidota bacterium]
MPAIHLLVKGKVQGVYFRAFILKKGISLGITGWVQNTDDGAVEIIANGNEVSLEQLKAWCYVGPPAAVVYEVISTDVDEHYANSFVIKN